ncbi:hypothetical protein H7J51_07145 [Mycobacterium crocinum]|uniref:DUF4190 domain-containing protein n=1 Tax=Mycolicibacterium crocinum TaxID=388459 RepID=A0ABY3TQA5_9MYCO|nr:hypothetical protein [Mycolicibacterium crocinum]MCV7215057.1 hypothetical protein [Mycolicibacterium crocinum]ULN42119.1 hypothetical protein MI149_03040 [Mycolicibacterium crocinum]
MATPSHAPDSKPDIEEQHPLALLIGLFLGFASVILTFGFLWPLAPLFPAVVAGASAVLPFKNHWHVARGAIYACLGVVAFEAVFVPILLLS